MASTYREVALNKELAPVFKRAVMMGKPKGVKHTATIQKEAAAQEMRKIIQGLIKPMLVSMLTAGFGSHKFYIKDDKGKWVVTSDEEVILARLNEGLEGTDFKWERTGGDWRALDALMDRAYGRPKETVEHTGEVRGIIQVIQQLEHGTGTEGEGGAIEDESGSGLQRTDSEEGEEQEESGEVSTEESGAIQSSK